MTDSPFADKLRLRSCALIVENNKLLLARHLLPTRDTPAWMPPGGGVQIGESLEQALIRELEEEAGFTVAVNKLRYIHEFIELPYHAVEFYFTCTRIDGTLKKGSDPELLEKDQILQDLQFVELSELERMHVYPEYIRYHFHREFFLDPGIKHIFTVEK